MGEVAAAVHDLDVAPPPAEPESQPQPATDQSVSMEWTGELIAPAAIETNQPETPPHDAVSPEGTPEPQPGESAAAKSPMDLLAKLLRGESARTDES